jgi:hypothetical protein
MALNHEAEVQDPVLVQAKLSDFVAQGDAGHNRGTGGTKPTAQGNGILDMHRSFRRERSLFVTSKDIEGSLCDEIPIRFAWDMACSLALPRDFTVERCPRGALITNRDRDLEIFRERETDDIEPGALKR